MYFQERITSMADICGKDDDHQHNSRSPNKQNALCQGQSIWEIISQTKNFKEDEAGKEFTGTEFVFLKETKPRVVIAFENTVRLEKYKGTKIIPSAITQLMIDLPDGSKFLTFPFFEDEPKQNLHLQDLTEEVKVKIAPDLKADFVKENGNYKEAIRKAMTILKDDAGNPDGNVIIITGSPPEDLIVVLLRDVCIKTFDVNSLPANTDELTNSHCLEVVKIPMSYGLYETYRKLIEAIETVCPTKMQDKFTETLKIEHLERNKSVVEIEVDDYTETVTFSIVTDKEGGNFLLESNGKKQNHTKKATYGNIVELSYSFNQAGAFNFSYPYLTGSDPPMLVLVRKTSKEGKYFSVKAIVHDTTVEEDSHQMPLIIYVIVRFGSYPVQNAKVLAKIRGPDGTASNLFLYDDGNGDPDITKNDGVYSRYFTAFSDKGDYTVQIYLMNPQKFARYGKMNTGYRSCCGSDVNRDGDGNIMDGVLLGPFTKIINTTSFTAKSGRPEDGYKPSRVTDLRIGETDDDGIVLKWTAPGEEGDHGAASRYEIKLFCGEEKTTKCDIDEVIQVLDMPVPLNYGTDQLLKITIIDKTQALSLGIIAINEKNKTSDVSNTVEIFRLNETLPEITTEGPRIEIADISKTGTIIGWVITGVLIIICILGVVIYFRRKQHKQPELNNIEENKDVHTVKSTFEAIEVPVRNESVKKTESFPVLLYTHDQLKDYKNKENDIPLYKLNVPSKQWRSSDAIANLNKESDRETKSLGSSSTVNLE